MDHTEGLDRYAPLLPIGIVGQLTDLTARQIRYYEECGLVQPARTEGDQRRYSLYDVETLTRVKSLLGRGKTLAEVQEHFRVYAPQSAPDVLSDWHRESRRRDIASVGGRSQRRSSGPDRTADGGASAMGDQREAHPPGPPPAGGTAHGARLHSVYPVNNGAALQRFLAARSRRRSGSLRRSSESQTPAH